MFLRGIFAMLIATTKNPARSGYGSAGKISHPVSRILYPIWDLCHLSDAIYPFRENCLRRFFGRITLTGKPARNIRDLAARKANSPQCYHCGWWALTPPSHPYPDEKPGRLFSSLLLYPHGYLSFNSAASCAVRTFLSHRERQSGRLNYKDKTMYFDS